MIVYFVVEKYVKKWKSIYLGLIIYFKYDIIISEKKIGDV